jgi:hypothetical protein
VSSVTGGKSGNEALGCPAWLVPEPIECPQKSVNPSCSVLFCSVACRADRAHERFCGRAEYAELVELGRAKEEHAHVAVAHLWAEECDISELISDVSSSAPAEQPTPASSEEWRLVSSLFPGRTIDEYNLALGRIALNSTCLRPVGPFELSMRAIAQVKNPLTRLQSGQRLEKLIEATVASKLDARAPVVGGIYRTQSSVNHSCDPNCAAPVAGPGGDCKLVLVAKREIQKDEEITFSYVDESLPTHERKRILLVNYHFDCNCPRCSGGSSSNSSGGGGGAPRLPLVD